MDGPLGGIKMHRYRKKKNGKGLMHFETLGIMYVLLNAFFREKIVLTINPYLAW